MLDFFKEIFTWFYDYINTFAMTFLTTMMAILPDDWQSSMQPIIQVINYVDYWFPVSFGLTLLTSWLAFQVTFIGVKFVLKVCPFIG